MTQTPANGVDPGWLDLRGPADARARTAFAGGLTSRLARHLERRRPGTGQARMVDVGAGTGAGARWLRDRLPVAQDWRLIDHDVRLLSAAVAHADGWARTVVADLADLPTLLREEPADVVTCQALLDVLTPEQVHAVLDPAVESGAAVLLSLNVTGEVALSPPHADDAVVDEAFNAHQRRGRRLGPDAGGYVADILSGHGYAVTSARTPWHLGPEDAALIQAWLEGRAEAAAEQEPDRAGQVRRWRDWRVATARRGDLTASVGHVDVLALPARPAVPR